MITELSPLFAKVATSVKPEDLLLQKGRWVRFTDQWPDSHKWATDKLFEVEHEPLLVPYAASYILPGADYKDIDLSNATAGLKLYPEDEGVLYQITLGLKPGNYLVHTYVPVNNYIYALGDTTMYPDVTSATLKYLGAKRPADSPSTAPLWSLYVIKDAPAFILRLYVDTGVDYDKVTVEFRINKCQLKLIESPTADQLARALRLKWHTELKGF
ncbi:MAG: hypothetical protein Q8O40_16270 [Chloroflexota bacterium]|nr:hypothetical protein [Chloroflexota bacterium]